MYTATEWRTRIWTVHCTCCMIHITLVILYSLAHFNKWRNYVYFSPTVCLQCIAIQFMDTLSVECPKKGEKVLRIGFGVQDEWVPWLIIYGTLDANWKAEAPKTINEKSLGILVQKGDDEIYVCCNALFCLIIISLLDGIFKPSPLSIKWISHIRYILWLPWFNADYLTFVMALLMRILNMINIQRIFIQYVYLWCFLLLSFVLRFCFKKAFHKSFYNNICSSAPI